MTEPTCLRLYELPSACCCLCRCAPLAGAPFICERPRPASTLVDRWGALPGGQEWGEVTGVAVDAKNTVIAVRRTDPPIIELNPGGRVLKMWGEKMFVWPHGFRIDKEGYLWITDGRAADGRGEQIFKIAPDGTRRDDAWHQGCRRRHLVNICRARRRGVWGQRRHLCCRRPCEQSRREVFEGRAFIKAWGKRAPGLVNSACRTPSRSTAAAASSLRSRQQRIQVFDQDGAAATSTRTA